MLGKQGISTKFGFLGLFINQFQLKHKGRLVKFQTYLLSEETKTTFFVIFISLKEVQVFYRSQLKIVGTNKSIDSGLHIQWNMSVTTFSDVTMKVLSGLMKFVPICRKCVIRSASNYNSWETKLATHYTSEKGSMLSSMMAFFSSLVWGSPPQAGY